MKAPSRKCIAGHVGETDSDSGCRSRAVYGKHFEFRFCYVGQEIHTCGEEGDYRRTHPRRVLVSGDVTLVSKSPVEYTAIIIELDVGDGFKTSGKVDEET